MNIVKLTENTIKKKIGKSDMLLYVKLDYNERRDIVTIRRDYHSNFFFASFTTDLKKDFRLTFFNQIKLYQAREYLDGFISGKYFPAGSDWDIKTINGVVKGSCRIGG